MVAVKYGDCVYFNLLGPHDIFLPMLSKHLIKEGMSCLLLLLYGSVLIALFQKVAVIGALNCLFFSLFYSLTRTTRIVITILLCCSLRLILGSFSYMTYILYSYTFILYYFGLWVNILKSNNKGWKHNFVTLQL